MSRQPVFKYRLLVIDRETGEKEMIYRLSICDQLKCAAIFNQYRSQHYRLKAIFKLKGTY